MIVIRRVVAAALLAAGSIAATGLPASATTVAAPVSTVTAAARCSVSVQKLGTLVLSRAVGTERTRLHTTCALKAPLTLTITPVGTTTKLGTIVFSGSGGVVKNNAVGVIHLTARNYKPGQTDRLAPGRARSATGSGTYATAPQKFVVKALGLTTFTSKSLDRKHGIIRTVGQEAVFSFTAGRLVAHNGSVVGFFREGSKGAWKRDTSDPKVTFTRAGRTTWNIQVRCGSWEYQMVQPSTRAVAGLAGNILVTTRTC